MNDMVFGNGSINLDARVYQNESLNFGRILPEMPSVVLSCAAHGNWLPEALPNCLRKY